MTRWITVSERIAIWGLAAGVLVTAAGFLQAVPWWIEVFAHFHWQYALGSALLTVFFLFRRHARAAVIAGLVLLLNLYPVADAHFAGSPGAVAAARLGGQLKLMSFNLWYRNSKYGAVKDYIIRSEADLVFLTEVTNPWLDALSSLETIYPYRFHTADKGLFEGHRSGIMVLSNRPLIEPRAYFDPTSGHAFAQVVRVDDDNAPWTLFGVHLQKPLFEEAALQERQLSELGRVVRETEGPIAIAGDFNATPYSPKFRAFVSATGVNRAAGGFNASWPSLVRPLGIPIDHVLTGRGMRARTTIGSHIGSDHRPMHTVIEWDG